MLKLTLNPESEGVEHTFKKSVISIGDGLLHEVDLGLPGESLQKVHVKVMEEEGKTVVINVANDPFVSLNKVPFGKKVVKEGDLLQIGRTVIRIDHIEEKKEPKSVSYPEVEVATPTEPPPQIIDFEEPTEIEEETFSQPTEDEVEEEEEFLHEIDEIETTTAIPKQKKSRSWAILVSTLILLFTLASFAAGVFYFRMSDRIIAEQKLVAEAVADLSMALTHAKIQHITPSKLNWSDPDFLRNNLVQVLSPKHKSFAELDSQGQLKDFPYLIRIYTELDLKQFIIIAQPTPTFFQRIIFKPSIVLDSHSMEIRKIGDIRLINRLLANQTPLDETTSLDVSNIIRDGTLIPLIELNDSTNGFIPPKTHALIRPNAVGYVYNAPRYYPFGEDLMTKAVALKENTRNSYEVGLLQYEIEAFSQFPDIILYTTKGLQQANFLVATLSVNQNGEFTNSHLLMNEKYQEISALPNSLYPASKSPEIQKESLLAESNLKNSTNPLQKLKLNPSHPLQLRLSSLVAEREKSLQEISDEIEPLIHQHTHGYVPDFHHQVQQLLLKYEQVDQEIQAKINKNIRTLYREYSTMPMTEFIAYINGSGMEGYFEDFLSHRKRRYGDNLISAEEIQELMRRIELSRNLLELERHVVATSEVLTLDNLPDTELLTKHQNQLHSKALQKLSNLLFSSESSIYYSPPQPANRIAVNHILKTAWVTDQDEFEFFVKEYDNIFEDPPENEEDEEEQLEVPFYTTL